MSTILIYEDIGGAWGGVTAKDIAGQIEKARAAGETALDVRINSIGGDVFDGVTIHNALMRSGLDVTTYVDGIAASAAAIILMAGDRIIAEPSGVVMVHNAATVAAGSAADFEEIAVELKTVDQAIAGIFASRTGQSIDRIRELLDAETWMSAEDAKAQGFVDEIAAAEAAPARATAARSKHNRGARAVLAEMARSIAAGGGARR